MRKRHGRSPSLRSGSALATVAPSGRPPGTPVAERFARCSAPTARRTVRPRPAREDASGRAGVEAWIEARCAARRRQDGESYPYRITAPLCRSAHTSAGSAVKENVPFWEYRICFDKFHVAKHLGDAVDRVRRNEAREKIAKGDRTLVGTRYDWLRDPSHFTREARAQFEATKRAAVRTARAYAVKEHAMDLWHYTTRTGAETAWKKWINWAIRTRLEPVKKVGQMVKQHLYGVVNAVVTRATNAKAESVNARIQRIKRMACGFRSRERFRNAIYFHLGGLDLHPTTHTIS